MKSVDRVGPMFAKEPEPRGVQVDKIVLRRREGSILIDSRIYIHLHMCTYRYFLHVD